MFDYREEIWKYFIRVFESFVKVINISQSYVRLKRTILSMKKFNLLYCSKNVCCWWLLLNVGSMSMRGIANIRIENRKTNILIQGFLEGDIEKGIRKVY